MTGWAASAVLLSDISSEIRLRQPKLILELGSGVSTVVMAYALEEIGEGHIVSLEHDKEYMDRTLAELDRHGLASWVDLRHAPLKPVNIEGNEWIWYDTNILGDLDRIDMVVVDGPPFETQTMARYPALPVVAARLSPSAVVVLDDADRRDERRCLKRWREEFPDLDLELRDSPKGTAILRRSAG
jgi:predicted O-methyltransferase YrrM